MTRPKKCRRISFIPGVTYFKPAGIPMRFLDEICLSLEETEAIRLKDIEDLDQAACAERMNVSRPTVQRILESARKKISDALLNGKAIKIEGGNVEMLPQHYVCENGHQWNMSLEQASVEPPQTCPVCNTIAISKQMESNFLCRQSKGRCLRNGHNH
jgi:uncharacterized protein